MNFDFDQIGFVVVKLALAVFMIIHIFAIIVVIRQASLASKVVVSDTNRLVMLFSYLYVIILILILLVIVLLPFL